MHIAGGDREGQPPVGDRPVVGEGDASRERVGAEGNLPAAQVEHEQLFSISGLFDTDQGQELAIRAPEQAAGVCRARALFYNRR